MPSKPLFIFNPEHDLALANGDANFNAPQSAKDFAKDVSLLPMWFADDGYVLNNSRFSTYESERYQQLGIKSIPISFNELENIVFNEIIPWGWNLAIFQQLKNHGVHENLLPKIEDIAKIRELSHRKTASSLMCYLKKYSIISNKFPEPAECLNTIEEIENFIEKHKSIILKVPLSGSGKGLRWINKKLTDSDIGWSKNLISKHECILGERQYNVIQDFAMEFHCDKEIIFAGYSLFKTNSGFYQGNLLVSDSYIEKNLQQWISFSDLIEIKKLVIEFLTHNIIGKYKGYLGVDMFVYQEDNNIKIHPAVEINLRMTMGMLSRIITDRFIDAKSIGWLQMEFNPDKGVILKNHKKKQRQYPYKISNHRITEGYISLCPVFEDTNYCLSMKIDKFH